MSPKALGLARDCGRLGLGLGLGMKGLGLGINGFGLGLVSDWLTNASVLESKISVLVSVSDS